MTTGHLRHGPHTGDAQDPSGFPTVRFLDPAGIERVGRLDAETIRHGDRHFSYTEIQVLPPVLPSKLIGVGLNYQLHANEVGMDQPTDATIFLKPPSALVGHLGRIRYPPNVGQVDYEGELVVVIGVRASRVEIKDAMRFVGGYTIGNDFTARDLQTPGSQWTLAKGFDTFAALGPAVIQCDEWRDRAITTTVNDELRQSASTSDLILGVPELIAYVSQHMTLEVGDVIFTGTPPGVGPVQVGDRVDVSIEGLGTLTNWVVDGAIDDENTSEKKRDLEVAS
jgi:2-keto-4-pentenoate hydratase/2-oxohepta-3-ene-1,7-dioic acid hydratase in catechol pathway